MRATPTNKCILCSKEIRNKRPQARYCSDRCRNDAQIERRRKAIREVQAEEGRQGGYYLMRCEREDCHKAFRAVRSDAKYCSAACKQADYRVVKRFMHLLMRK